MVENPDPAASRRNKPAEAFAGRPKILLVGLNCHTSYLLLDKDNGVLLDQGPQQGDPIKKIDIGLDDSGSQEVKDKETNEKLDGLFMSREAFVKLECDLYTFSISELQPNKMLLVLVQKHPWIESHRWSTEDGSCELSKQSTRLAKAGAARTMLGDSNYANKDSELRLLAQLAMRFPQIGHLKPFGCQVTILNTSDHLGKFEGKADEGYLVGYAPNSKAYRVYNLTNKRVEETMNLRFLEDKPEMFTGTQETNTNAGTQDPDSESEVDEQCSAVSDSAGGNPAGSFQPAASYEPAGQGNPAVSTSVSADFSPVHADESTLPPGQSLGSSENNTRFPVPSEVVQGSSSQAATSHLSLYDDDFNSGDLASPVLTRSRAQKSKFGESAFIGYKLKHFEDPDWVAAMQEEMQSSSPESKETVPLLIGKTCHRGQNDFEEQKDARSGQNRGNQTVYWAFNLLIGLSGYINGLLESAFLYGED
ncbi:putative ribonuclease H-like domain-containing protein [Tanacetum coccineum]|uniref:Ribonuclease H-like domain-containing protein n=1 Tax=Tanacetum coccineum TaxID=301880 RepID=A0ABQ5BNU6_9ASTR